MKLSRPARLVAAGGAGVSVALAVGGARGCARVDRGGRRRRRILGDRHVCLLPRLRGLADDGVADPDAGVDPHGGPDDQRQLGRREGDGGARHADRGRPRRADHRAGQRGRLHGAHAGRRRFPRHVRAERRPSPRTPPAQTLYFPTIQTCESGETAWIEIPAEGQDPEELESPAPGVEVVAASRG